MTTIKNQVKLFVIVTVLYVRISTFAISNNQRYNKEQILIQGRINKYLLQRSIQNINLNKLKENLKRLYQYPQIITKEQVQISEKTRLQTLNLSHKNSLNNVQIKKRLLQYNNSNNNQKQNIQNTTDLQNQTQNYSTNCTIQNCQQCQIKKYQIKTEIEDPNTGQIIQQIINYQQQICKICKNGFYPYLYKKLKQQFEKDQIDSQNILSFKKKALSKYQQCQSLKYKLYQAKLVVAAYDIQQFMENQKIIVSGIVNLFEQFYTKPENVNLMFINQGSIIIDFWIQIAKEYNIEATILDIHHQVILKGDIISLNIQQVPYPENNGTNNNGTNNQTNPVNKQASSNNQLLLPIVIAGALSGFLAIIVVYFLCIKKMKKYQIQGTSNPEDSNPVSQSNQHNTSIIANSKTGQNGKVSKKQRFQVTVKSQTKITQESDIIQSMQQLARIQQQSGKPIKVLSEGL